MATYLSPGVYTRESISCYYVKQISTSSCGMVGAAERGPINKPVLVTSWEQFINKFGSYVQAGYLPTRHGPSSTTAARCSTSTGSPTSPTPPTGTASPP